jgi:hypothetical protein
VTTQIQLRRDTSANWAAANPVLAEGEIGMDMTVNAFKVGDGASAWDDIDYAGTDISLDDYYTKLEANDAFQPKGDYLTDFVEEDPTVPDHVKDITQDDIDGWNAGGGGGDVDLSDYYTKTESDGKYQVQGNYALVGASYSKAESDTAYQAKGSYATASHNHNGVYQPAGSYAAASHTHNYAAVGASYTKAESDGRYEAKGGGGGNFVPLSGNSTIAGTLTATDFVATSDERLKDNITPVPVGLIDDIKPVSWDWKDGSGPSAGVVAQQLQSVGLGDYVHENEDGQLGVNYQALTAILLAEVIALKKVIK